MNKRLHNKNKMVLRLLRPGGSHHRGGTSIGEPPQAGSRRVVLDGSRWLLVAVEAVGKGAPRIPSSDGGTVERGLWKGGYPVALSSTDPGTGEAVEEPVEAGGSHHRGGPRSAILQAGYPSR